MRLPRIGVTLTALVLALISVGCRDDTIDWTEVETLVVAIDVGADPAQGVRARLVNGEVTGPCVVVGSDVGATLDGQPLTVESRGSFDEGIAFSQAASCTAPTFVTAAEPNSETTSVLEIAGLDRSVTVQVTNLVAVREFELDGGDGVVHAGETAAFQWTLPTDTFDLSFAGLSAVADSGWSAQLYFSTADSDLALTDGRLSFTIPDDAPVGPIALRLGLLHGPAMPIDTCDGAQQCTATLGIGATSIDVGVIELASP